MIFFGKKIHQIVKTHHKKKIAALQACWNPLSKYGDFTINFSQTYGDFGAFFST
jgi:hypothetical protein